MNWYKKIVESETKRRIIAAMNKIFYLLRGIPGSGKSFLGKQLAGETGEIFASDDFFINEQGKYNWREEDLTTAHNWNYQRVLKALEQGISPVILDNTNVTLEEMKFTRPLIETAINNNYDVEITEPDTPWKFNAEELAKRNTHGVPLESIQEKIDKWDPNITVENILDD